MSLLDELAASRRSIRKYRPEAPPEAWLEEMLKLALLSPSSGNSQPVWFIRIDSAGRKEALREAMEEGRQRFLRTVSGSDQQKKLRNWINAYYRFSSFMFDAPILMAVGTVTARPGFSHTLSEAGIVVPGKRWSTDADLAVGLALQSLILKGQEYGLGSCILTAPLVFIEKAEEILGLLDVEIKCFLTLGFPMAVPKAPKKKSVADIYRVI